MPVHFQANYGDPSKAVSNELNSYLDYCSHRREYRIWEKEKKRKSVYGKEEFHRRSFGITNALYGVLMSFVCVSC